MNFVAVMKYVLRMSFRLVFFSRLPEISFGFLSFYYISSLLLLLSHLSISKQHCLVRLSILQTIYVLLYCNPFGSLITK